MMQLYYSWTYVTQNLYSTTEILAHLFSVTLFTIARNSKHPRCVSADEWIMKISYILQLKVIQLLKKRNHDIIKYIDAVVGNHSE